ncbi:MAG: cell division protein FtsH, partial [Clostridia bacterium]|nr:cell division protein FtsH [Clostridia bacterium]
HESGHAILAKLLPNCDPVHEVSIIPRGQAAGYTMTRPDSDDNHITKNKLLDDIVMTLGGRVAEELIIKDISAGASGDIQMITKRARAMVTEWGMSDKVGPISYGSDREVFIGRDMASHVTYSEQTAALIDAEVKEIIENALAKARDLLKANKNLLDTMARVLVERETIYTEEVNMIMDGKSAEEVFDFMDKNEEALMEKPFERGNANIESENSSIETIANFESEPKVEENTNENTDVEQKSDERYDENAPKEEN